VKADRPSRTAHLVTYGRALADAGLSHIPNFHDPAARAFLSEKTKRKVARTAKEFGEGKRSIGIEMARTMADMIALRTSAIDAAVRAAVAAGAKQLVILGAGYDGRAWRMKELTGVKVFEVDHPATQGQKRSRVTQLPPAIGHVTFVSMNFERESLDTALSHAGHDRSSPTCWIWEGVVMYLSRNVMVATLADIARLSAPGSTLIVNYHTLHGGLLRRAIFRLIGEPQVSAWTPTEMADDLRSVGFLVREDSSMIDWNNRFAQAEGRVERGFYMRVVVAGK
jgi:methyltransferase (TIGR00027 family)